MLRLHWYSLCFAISLQIPFSVQCMKRFKQLKPMYSHALLTSSFFRLSTLSIKTKYVQQKRFFSPSTFDTLTKLFGDKPVLAPRSDASSSLIPVKATAVESADHTIAQLTHMHVAQERTQKNDGIVFTYVGTSDNAKTHNNNVFKTMPINADDVLVRNVPEHFAKLSTVLKKELREDLNKLGSHFLKSSYKPSNSIDDILKQMPPNLRSYYGRMIVDLADNTDFTSLHCIKLHTRYQASGNKFVTTISTHVEGYGKPTGKRECCKICSNLPTVISDVTPAKPGATINNQNTLILLPHIKDPREILRVAHNASSEEIDTAYFKERLKMEAACKDIALLQEAYNTIKKKIS